MNRARRTLTSLLLAVALIAPLAATGCGKTVGETIDDATITTRVKTALLNDPGVGGLRIDVDTFKGVVTLSGRDKTRQDEATAVAGGLGERRGVGTHRAVQLSVRQEGARSRRADRRLRGPAHPARARDPGGRTEASRQTAPPNADPATGSPLECTSGGREPPYVHSGTQ